MTETTPIEQPDESLVAIVGMAGRFPGAASVDELWENVAAGVCSIRDYGDDELRAAGVGPEELADPAYVKAGAPLEGIDQFDASFFGYPPRVAEVMDPQHRLFLEHAWQALEHAGYDPGTYRGLIGVFAGSAFSGYVLHNIAKNPDVIDATGAFQVDISNTVDALASTVSYKLNLRGPSVAVQTFCSTSLVAVHLACQSLLTYECDVALAGGVAIAIPHGVGYRYQEGGILSPDGRCRSFDAGARGSVMGSGVGVVALRRLADAVGDGDAIYAVIRGSAVNNDGLRKVGYTAPGLAGQAAVILSALGNAGVAPATVGYLEAHGTATALGDAVELEASIQALGRATAARRFCALGSVKANVGHLDRAAGVTGLIKAALALHHRWLPPQVGFTAPGPDVDLDDSPFYVNVEPRPWPAPDGPRRAGVSAFGLGGTNAHVVLEEAPPPPPPAPSPRPRQLLVLSARTPGALDAAAARLAAHLRAHPGQPLADVAHTLAVGRAAFNHRRTVVAADHAEAAAALEAPPAPAHVAHQSARDRPVAFLLPGVGDHRPGQGSALYAEEDAFRAAVDHSCELLAPLVGCDLRPLLFPPAPPPRAPQLLGAAPAGPLGRAALAQPAGFVLEHALALLWQSWGVRPQALVGYSLGEYVCACLAGVLSLPDALRLVAARARLVDALPGGAMLAVAAGADAVAPLLPPAVAVAARTSPQSCVVAGPEAEVVALAAELEEREVASQRVATSHALHTAALAPAVAELVELAATLELRPPAVPYVSNVTGTWMTAADATDPAYWGRHLVSPVQLEAGVGAVLADAAAVVVEVGPGHALAPFVRQHPSWTGDRALVTTLPGAYERTPEAAHLQAAVGRLWLAGVAVDWELLHGPGRRRVPLPTYPFEHRRFWVEPANDGAAPAAGNGLAEVPAAPSRSEDIDQWFYAPTWRPTDLPDATGASDAPGVWIVFADGRGVGTAVAARLKELGHRVVEVSGGDAFARVGEDQFVLRCDQRDDHLALLAALEDVGVQPTGVLHLLSLDSPAEDERGRDRFLRCQDRGFHSVLAAAQAIGARLGNRPPELLLVTGAVHAVAEADVPDPNQMPLVGLATVVTQEYPGFRSRCIDVGPADGAGGENAVVDHLVAECGARSTDSVVAYRDGTRWAEDYAPASVGAPGNPPLRHRGVYLITGGLGRIGLTLAAFLAERHKARLALVARRPMPPREEWPTIAADGDEGERDDVLVATVKALLQVEALGGEVLVVEADVADPDQLRGGLAQVRAAFGPLDGVVHAAGTSRPADFGPLATFTRSQADAHFGPKAHALSALEAVLDGEPLDFCVVFSSLAAVLGGLGFGAYAAANRFMDAFAERHNRRPGAVPWISVDWDTWRFAANTDERLGATVARYELSPEEGWAVFERAAAARGRARLVVSTGDLAARVRQWVRLESLAPAEGGDGGGGAPVTAADAPGRVAAIWEQVLGVGPVGLEDNFFDLGGNSLLGLSVVAKLQAAFGQPVSAVALFEAPTVAALAARLRPAPAAPGPDRGQALAARRGRARRASGPLDVAVVGMAGRFPGADDVAGLWANLCAGVESLTRFSHDELRASGVPPEVLADPAYVPARPVLGDVAGFDAAFFGYTPREAELMDPQQRLFHECAWEALEHAGYEPLRYPGLIGLFAGTNINFYLMRLAGDPGLAGLIDEAIVIENDKDALATNVAYKLNLRGPSVAVQTFCSTSLVATHLACRSLRGGECDLALAGGVSVRVPVAAGHLYREGDQYAPDGHCRPFDADGAGTTFGDGVAAVVLKRLEDAVADGDQLYAVVKGAAVNNDGHAKVGYAAPSVGGQAEAVAAALAEAGVDPATIGYVEAHGTATRLGDPVEVAALTRAYRRHTDRRGYCWLGSLKANVGHLDRAAGVTGLIKATLALHHGHLPPTLHYRRPNPEIDLAASPFRVVAEPTPWPRGPVPRRAGVNALGVGGTNAHVVLEEAPPPPPPAPSPRPRQLLVLSARTPGALDAAAARLAAHLRAHPGQPLADVAHTLAVGRAAFNHRRTVVAADHAEAAAALEAPPAPAHVAHQSARDRPVAFLLPGVGDHRPGQGSALYAEEDAFRAAVDHSCELLAPLVGCDLRPLLFPPAPPPRAPQLLGAAPAGPLGRAALAQPAGFVLEHALALLWQSWGVRPQALVGYSLGEYVCACLAGVLSLPDALRLVAARARLVDALPGGAMLAVAAGADAVAPLLPPAVAVAARTSPQSCVVAGPEAEVVALAAELEEREVASQRVATSHALHTAALAPAVAELVELAATLELRPPAVPYVSNVTGTWMTAADATDPAYWGRHLVSPVQLEAGVGAVLSDAAAVVVEVGPGHALAPFVRQHPSWTGDRALVTTLPGAYERTPEAAHLQAAVGRLWLAGVAVDWELLHGPGRRRVPLPTYPFEHRRFWVEPANDGAAPAAANGWAERRADLTSWFATTSWLRTASPDPTPSQTPEPAPGPPWLVLADACGVGEAVAEGLRARGQAVVVVVPGPAYARLGPDRFALDPADRPAYGLLLDALADDGLAPERVVHAWGVGPPPAAGPPTDGVGAQLEASFYSLMALAQALGDRGVQRLQLDVVTSGVQDVLGGEELEAAKATALGPVRVIPQEYPGWSTRAVDVRLGPGGALAPPDAAALVAELAAPAPPAETVALRGGRRWAQAVAPVAIGPARGTAGLRPGGAYLVTGGLGGLGLAVAGHLVRALGAKVALVGRTPLPPRSRWPELAQGPDLALARRLAAVLALEAEGAEVAVVAADVAQPAQARAAVAEARRRLGALHGVFHAAGVPGVGLLQRKSPAAAAATLAPKVQGTLALYAALDAEAPEAELVVLFSSVTSATGGGPGQADYCAANAFLDADALARSAAPGRHPRRRTVALGWGEWQWDAWQQGLEGFPPEVRARLVEHRRRYGIHDHEGVEALLRVLDRDLAHVFVTTQDLAAMVADSRRATADRGLDQLREERRSRPRHPRPELRSSYAEPTTDLERTIAAVWSEILGVEPIGVDDNFFELGGNSLLGIGLTSRLRKETGRERLAPHVLYEAPSVAALAEYLGSTHTPPPPPADLDGDAQRRRERLKDFRRRAQSERT